MNNFKIRNIADKDKEEIADVYISSWKSAYKNILPNDYLNSLKKEDFDKEIDTVKNLVIEDNGKIIGIINFDKARDSDDKYTGEIVAVYILEEYRRLGLGEILFESASLSLIKMGMNKVYLWVLKENKSARKFYEKMNMQISNETKSIEIQNKSFPLVKYEKELM